MPIRTAIKGAAGFRGAGCVRSGVDGRDRLWAPLAGALPLPDEWDERHLEPYLPTVFDQGASNSCVAQASAMAMALVEAVLGLPFAPRSRRWWYLMARLADRIEGDVGSRIRTAMKVAAKHGVMLESDHPWSVRKLDKRPKVDLIMAGHEASGFSYEWIRQTGEERLKAVRLALQQGLPVVFGGPVSRQYQRLSRSEGQRPWNLEGQRVVGLHARTFVRALPDGHFREVNSYGRRWGDQGLATIEDAYIAEEAFDVIVFRDWKRARRQVEALRAA